MSAFLSFRCLVTAKLLAAVLLAAAPIDASRAANGTKLLINGKTGKCLTIAGGTSPANNLEAVQFDCDGDLSRSWHLNGVGDAFQIHECENRQVPDDRRGHEPGEQSPSGAVRLRWRSVSQLAH